MGDRMVDMSAKWSYQGVAKPLGEGVPHGDFTCKVVRGGGCCHRWGNPCGSKRGCKVSSARGRGCWGSREGMFGTSQRENRALCLGGGWTAQPSDCSLQWGRYMSTKARGRSEKKEGKKRIR